MFTLRLHDIYMTFTLHLNLHLHLRLHWITLHTFTCRLTLTHTGHYIALHFHLNRKCVTFHLHSHFKNFPKSTHSTGEGKNIKQTLMTDSQLVKRKLTHTHWDLKKNTSVEKNLLERTEKWKKKKSPTFSTFLLTVFYCQSYMFNVFSIIHQFLKFANFAKHSGICKNLPWNLPLAKFANLTKNCS